MTPPDFNRNNRSLSLICSTVRLMIGDARIAVRDLHGNVPAAGARDLVNKVMVTFEAAAAGGMEVVQATGDGSEISDARYMSIAATLMEAAEGVEQVRLADVPVDCVDMQIRFCVSASVALHDIAFLYVQKNPRVRSPSPTYDAAAFAVDLDKELADVRALLIAKNERYGDSALNPVRALSRASTIEQLKVRIDDKISRLMRGSGEETEDVELDLLGYFVLLQIARRRGQA